MPENRRFIIEGPDNFSMSINSLLEITHFSVMVRCPECYDDNPLAWKDYFLTTLFRYGQMLPGTFLWDEEPETPSVEEYWKRNSMIELKSIKGIRVPLAHFSGKNHKYATMYHGYGLPVYSQCRNEYLVHFLPCINKQLGYWLNGTCRMSLETAMNMVLDARVLRWDRLIFNHAPCMTLYK